MFMGSQSDRTDWEGGSTKGKAPLNKSKRIAIVGSSLALVLLCLFFFAGGKGADFHSRMPFHLGRDSTLPRVCTSRAAGTLWGTRTAAMMMN